MASRHDLDGRVAVLIVDLAPVLGAPARSWSARPVSKYPAADLDMAFVVPEEVPAGQLGETIRSAAADVLESLVLFDVWRDASLGEGGRSLAFRARLRAPDRTLTDAEVARVRDRVAAAAFDAHRAVLRTA